MFIAAGTKNLLLWYVEADLKEPELNPFLLLNHCVIMMMLSIVHYVFHFVKHPSFQSALEASAQRPPSFSRSLFTADV